MAFRLDYPCTFNGIQEKRTGVKSKRESGKMLVCSVGDNWFYLSAQGIRNCLRKVSETRPQKELSAVERSGNLLGAFDVAGADISGTRILLVDDLATTGSTLDECAKTLKVYGASQVYAVTAARTRFFKDDPGSGDCTRGTA